MESLPRKAKILKKLDLADFLRRGRKNLLKERAERERERGRERQRKK